MEAILGMLGNKEFWVMLLAVWKGLNIIIVGVLTWKKIPTSVSWYAKMQRIVAAILGWKKKLDTRLG